MKSLIKSMGAIERASKASGGVKKTVEAFEKQVKLHHKSSTHSHKSSLEDEKIIMADLRDLKPFNPFAQARAKYQSKTTDGQYT